MKDLSSCPSPPVCFLTKRTYHGAILGGRSGQRLELTSDEPFVVFSLDDDKVDWPDGKKPDGVLVAEVGGVHWICFIELKGRSSDPDKAFDQLHGGAKHFAPFARDKGVRSHGDDHHDQWAACEDDIGLTPAKPHRVVGLFVTFKSVTQVLPPPPIKVAGKVLSRKAVQVAKRYPNWAEASPRILLRKAGLIR